MSTQMTDRSFADLGLPVAVLERLQQLGFTQPTPIQAQSIPVLLGGADVLGEAQTGTGKTAAFGLPALSMVDASQAATQVLVVTPTRELTIQVADALTDFSRGMARLQVTTVYGGAPFAPQVKALKGGAQVVVGTPGRLIDLLNKGVLRLDKLRMAVLDEADEMLNMGFIEDIEAIMTAVPDSAQRTLFSATMPTQIRKLAQRFLRDSVNIRIENAKQDKASIRQLAWQVSVLHKMTALTRLLETMDYQRVLVFVRTRQDTLEVAEQLQGQGFKAAALNGDLNQAQREQTVNQLRSGHIEILVATDVVARGLDVPEITHVINYDLPGDHESYVHRIGRTGRAGRSGEAILFFRPRERHLLKHYERATNSSIEYFEVPTAAQLSAHRQQQLLNKLTANVEQQDLTQMQTLLQQMLSDTDLTAEQLAASLLLEQQASRPLFIKDDPAPRPQRERKMRDPRDGRDSRDSSPRKERRSSRANDVEFDTYRIQVGREHGARPGDIVGAIANEAEMDSRFIGQIQLFDGHSLVELPKGMPKEVLQVLQKARVRQQPMSLQLSDASITRQRPPRGASKGRDRGTERKSERGSERPRARKAQGGAARRFM